MKKRMLALLLVLALCACLAPMAFASSEEPVAELEELEEVVAENPAEEGVANKSKLTLNVKDEKTSYDAGDEIVVFVNISNDNTKPVAMDITFDFDGLTVKSAESLVKSGASAFNTSNDRLLTLSYESEGNTVTATVLTGDIAKITLVAPRQTEKDTQDYTFKATVTNALNINEEVISFEAATVQKTIKVNKALALLGDVNADGKVNNKDSLLLFKYVSKQIKESGLADYSVADVNADTKVNNKDSLLLFKYVSKQISSFSS